LYTIPLYHYAICTIHHTNATLLSLSLSHSLVCHNGSVKRRYRQFLTLHKQLSQSLPHIVATLPKLPAKKIFGSSLDPRFVEERRGALEEYLTVLTSTRESWSSNELVSFLDDDESSFYLAMQIQFGRVVQHVAVLERVCKDMQEELEQTRAIVRAQSGGVRKLIAEVDMVHVHMREMRKEVKEAVSKTQSDYNDSRNSNSSHHRSNSTPVLTTQPSAGDAALAVPAMSVLAGGGQKLLQHSLLPKQPVAELDARVSQLLLRLIPHPTTARQRSRLLKVQYTVHHTPYTVHRTPYTIHHTPYTVHHTPYTILILCVTAVRRCSRQESAIHPALRDQRQRH
jgi:hypothetical protein